MPTAKRGNMAMGLNDQNVGPGAYTPAGMGAGMPAMAPPGTPPQVQYNPSALQAPSPGMNMHLAPRGNQDIPDPALAGMAPPPSGPVTLDPLYALVMQLMMRGGNGGGYGPI